ncbi:alkylglycerol monooxygenase-like isoform X1 [Mytilus edulis]|uniref:alkylglycerol monooxygenase-like isoform X1 n=2 Tax=Mytilus edulis TaxID=6550 RepID=UPI0039EF8859
MAKFPAEPLRRLFYFVSPNETSFEKLEEVPKYVDEAIPYFVSMIIIEAIVRYIQGKPLPRFNDGFSSVANGLLSLMHGLLFRSVELSTYVWFYERFNMIQLPWNNPWTWILGMVGVDFCYYWVHRWGHEVNIIWAAHQTHHSSEDYNLTTALRQSCLLKYISWMFYLPMALCVPPSIFLVHNQFSLLYQFWIHTETIKSIGPLEWILNSPGHHRAHHGRNRQYIDKNFGGTLIIFDRLFGTFEAEKEEVVYGLVHPLDSWGPIHSQICHLQYMMKTFIDTSGIGNKLSVIFKGPGWSPGKPRLGLIEDIPMVSAPMPKFEGPMLPTWMNVYIWVHFALLIVGYDVLAHRDQSMNAFSVVCYILYIIYCLEVFGALFDARMMASYMELFRCLCFIIVCKAGSPTIGMSLTFTSLVYWIYIGSAILWGYLTFNQYTTKFKKAL